MAPSRFGVPALERGIAIVELLAGSPQGASTEEIAEALQLPRSSAFGLVRALHGLGWLDHGEGGRNLLSLHLLSLAHRAHRLDLQRVTAPHLRALRDSLGLTVHLAAPADDGRVVYLDKVDGPGFVRFDTYVGKHADAHLTAVGKALIAHLPPAELEPAIARAARRRRATDRGPSTAAALRAQLAEVRARGYALEDEEEVEGVRCAAAPIGGVGGPALAAVGCIALTRDLPLDDVPLVAERIVACTTAIADQLGPA
jgi:DNA-binding IclR family transcriptional regulator